MKDLVPLFPLPGSVFFPGTALPLHVFEPRYRQLVRDQLEGDGRIAMALLSEDGSGVGSPPIHPVVTVGVIRRFLPLPDGRFHLELIGRHRARILLEAGGRPYRRAELAPLVEIPAVGLRARRARRSLVERLDSMARELDPELTSVVVHSDLSLGRLCDRVASVLPLQSSAKQLLLEEPDPVARSLSLLSLLDRCELPSPPRGPSRGLPGFSLN